MRKKLVTAAVVGALAVSGAAVGGTAFAAQPSTTGTAASPLDRIKQALAGLVGDKTITQAQADKVASALAQAGVGEHRPGFGFGPGMRGGRGLDLATAAKTLNMSETDVMTALRSGKSLAAIAKEKSVSVDTLVTALVTAEKQRIADAVKAGRLTQTQADQVTKDLQARVTARVNATPPQGGPGFGRHGGWGGPGTPGAPGAPGTAPSTGSSPSGAA